MGRYTGAKNKLSRRYGIDLGLKSKAGSIKLARRLNVPPGDHGPKGRKRRSEYGDHLREKQKLRFIYGVSEKQLTNYFKMAAKVKGATGLALLSTLEKRLDNTVFRLGFAPTRAASRQIVTHGHITVNGDRLNIPSYLVKEGDLVSLAPTALEIPIVKTSLEDDSLKLPAWLERKAAVGKVAREAKRDEIDTDINEQLIVEYYSR